VINIFAYEAGAVKKKRRKTGVVQTPSAEQVRKPVNSNNVG
jgi:hypothetical protein